VVKWSEFLAAERSCIVFPVRYELNLYMLCRKKVDRLCGLVVKSSWLWNGDALCFLWGMNWIYICYVEESRPPLWCSGLSSLLQIQRSGLDSRRYQIFWEVMGLERGPLSLVEYNWGATWKKKYRLRSRKPKIRPYGSVPRGTIYPQKLALTLPTSGGRYSSLADSGHGACIVRS
jgi:hypothetical protein